MNIILMMNWKDYLSSSKSSIKHIIKSFSFALIFSTISYSQIEIAENSNSKTDSIFIPIKSPWTAVLLSAAAPGAGQIYNESYWKAPVIWGISGWLIYNWVNNNKEYTNYGDLYLSTQNENYKRLRTFYRDQRDMFTIYLGLTYFLNLVDAYVDAQLFDFTVEEDFYSHQPRLNIRLNLR